MNAKNPNSESKGQGWMTAAVLIVTVVNGGIAFFGWNAAKSIKEFEASAHEKLNAIQEVTDRSYILYARASEREFTEIVAESPGIELTGPAADQAKASIEEDKKSLDILEREIAPDKRLPTRYLLEGYLALAKGNCRDAIGKLDQYSKETPVKYLLLASAHRKCKEIQKAIELNNKIRDMPMTRPGERIKAKALNNNGNAMVRSGQLPEAIAYYKSAIRTDPSLYGVNYNLAAVYSMLGQQEDAVRWLCKFRSSHDGNVVDEVESDPDNDFSKLRQALGPNWKSILATRLRSCL